MPKRKSAKRTPTMIQRFFGRVVFLFIGGTMLLIGFILYVSFSKTHIAITPASETITKTVSIAVRADAIETSDAPEAPLPGLFVHITSDTTTIHEGLTPARVEHARATGTVHIVNTYSRVQPLVATTRLLTPEGLLFRTTERADVPPGGSVDVPVQADETGSQYEIGPSHFTIPGLWKGLQDQIYGESDAPMTGSQQEISVASSEDIHAAEDSATEATVAGLRSRAADALVAQGSPFSLIPDATVVDITTDDIGVAPGQEVENIPVTQHGAMDAVAFDEDALFTAAVNAFREQAGEDRAIRDIDSDSFHFTVAAIDMDTGTATLDVTIAGTVRADLTGGALDPSRFTNRRKSEIETILAATPGIAAYDVSFTPLWAFRSSSLADNIEIVITD